MKTLIMIIAISFTSLSFAGTCKISGRMYEDTFSCPFISVSKYKDVTQTECIALAKYATTNNFFDMVKPEVGERLLHVNFKFKEGKLKIKDQIKIEDQDEACTMDPIFSAF